MSPIRDGADAVFLLSTPREVQRETLRVGDERGGVRLVELAAVVETGLQVVKQSGRGLILCGLGLMCAGLALALWQTIVDEQRGRREYPSHQGR